MARDKRYYENRLTLLQSRDKENSKICKKIMRKLRKLEAD